MAIIKGSSIDNSLHGTSSDDALYGFSGDDVLRGGSGDDALYGGSGDDRLFGGSGDDLLQGGSGDDLLDGGSGDDRLFGGSGDDILRGGSGDDVLSGGSGDDELNGGSGDDQLLGGTGDDVLKGGAGDDVLTGGAGDDILTGGSGDDVFKFAGSFGSDTITDFGVGDKIDLTGIHSLTSVSDLQISEVDGNTIITVPGTDGSTITVVGHSAAEVISQIEVACLMRGTLIATPDGDVPVEHLRIGDSVRTIDGTIEQIKWIGKRAYARPFLAYRGKVAPIMFAPGSLGDGLPSAPLFVSPEHAMYVDNVLVVAKYLENGTTIRQINDFDLVEYFHLEFDQAQVIYANGAPTESYVESGNRRMFANYASYVELYGESRTSNSDKDRRFYTVYGGAALTAIQNRLSAERASAA